MYTVTNEIPVRRGVSRRRKRLRRSLKRLRTVAGVVVLLALALACGSFAADCISRGAIPGLTGLLGYAGPAVGVVPADGAAGDTVPNVQAAASGGVQLAVPATLQMPELQNGCEATSLAMVLQYMGYPAGKEDIAYGYMPRGDIGEVGDMLYGPWPGDAYPGDPATSRGFYCYAGPVAEGGNAFLAGQGAAGCFTDATGTSLDSLQTSLLEGRPVIIWVTIDYGDWLEYLDFTWQLPDGRTYTPYANLHCVVLTGFDDTGYILCDPLLGELSVERGVLAASYEVMGSRAVVYEP